MRSTIRSSIDGGIGHGVRGPGRSRAMCRRASIALAIVALALSATVLAPARAIAWTVNPTTRTAAQTRAMWEQLKPTFSGSAYAVAPSVKAPYAPGSLQPGFLADGVNTINFARYLAGLPYDVTLNPTRNLDAQYGAVLLAAGTFSHTPPKPADMDQAFYDRGYASTSSSNIGWGYSDAVHFQTGCLADSDANNIDRLGHRRWLLNPRMKQTGIGYAEARHITYAFDLSRTEVVDYSAITWPSAGLFPVECFNAQTPWSITLNPAKYDWDAGGHTVTLRRLFDGRTWTFNASDTNKSGEYFNANFAGYGVANVFVFRPDPASIAYCPGNEFQVTLSGGIYAEGTRTPATVTYRTTFMSLAPSAPVSVYRFYNVTNGTHFYTPSATERDTVVSNWPRIYRYEGVAYGLDPAANSQPLYRFYNRRIGSHFYTADASERDSIISKLSSVYTYEGETYKVNPASNPTGVPVYRFVNRRTGGHFYTASAAEKASVMSRLSATYAYEGIGFYLGQ